MRLTPVESDSRETSFCFRLLMNRKASKERLPTVVIALAFANIVTFPFSGGHIIVTFMKINEYEY